MTTASSMRTLNSLNRLLTPGVATPLAHYLARAVAALAPGRLLGLAETANGHDPTIVWRASAPGGASLMLFVWPAGAATPVHDHTSWGVYACLSGELTEERYARLDNGARADFARLRLLWRREWRWGGISTLRPYDGGIHRVANRGERPAVSLHIYGPRMAAIDGRDYDPARDYVCDRVEG
ncbi:MAG TPA: cysteine dioxygenase family protein [Roseiflexaceae bacterium]|nr:cysteine dioxygenase family protein [Roseiflexaceae bacterium]